MSRYTALTCIVLTALVLLAPRAPTQAQNEDPAIDEAAIAALVRGFARTREPNDSDAAALSALLTADVDQLHASGSIRIGRDDVIADSLAASQAAGGRFTIELESLRWLTDNTVIVDGHYGSLGRADNAPTRTSMVIVLREGEWKIAAIRNMSPATLTL
jgi:uncharacterized protein (TIGR02246 family)